MEILTINWSENTSASELIQIANDGPNHSLYDAMNFINLYAL